MGHDPRPASGTQQPVHSRARAAVGACAPREVLPLRPGVGPPGRGRHVEDAPSPRAASQCASSRIKPHVVTQVAWMYLCVVGGRTMCQHWSNTSAMETWGRLNTPHIRTYCTTDRRAHCVTHATCRLSRVSRYLLYHARPRVPCRARTARTSRHVSMCRARRVSRTRHVQGTVVLVANTDMYSTLYRGVMLE